MKCSRREERAPQEKQGPRIWGRDARESLGPRLAVPRNSPSLVFAGDDENRRSTPRAEIGLACIRIGLRLYRLGPVADARGHAAAEGEFRRRRISPAFFPDGGTPS